MNHISRVALCISIFVCLCGNSALMAQPANDGRNLPAPKNLAYSHGLGFYPKSLVELVNNSHLIVRGKYGKFLSNEIFFGYGRDIDDVRQQFKTNDEAALLRHGLPMSEYEIIVNEVIKGEEVLPDYPVLRIIENPNAHLRLELIEERSGDHLFFFMINPDNTTLGLIGGINDLKETGDVYTFRARSSEGTRVGTTNPANKEQLLQEVIRIVEEAKN